jgi:hypothetical protein
MKLEELVTAKSAMMFVVGVVIDEDMGEVVAVGVVVVAILADVDVPACVGAGSLMTIEREDRIDVANA